MGILRLRLRMTMERLRLRLRLRLRWTGGSRLRPNNKVIVFLCDLCGKIYFLLFFAFFASLRWKNHNIGVRSRNTYLSQNPLNALLLLTSTVIYKHLCGEIRRSCKRYVYLRLWYKKISNPQFYNAMCPAPNFLAFLYFDRNEVQFSVGDTHTLPTFLQEDRGRHGPKASNR